MWVSKTPMSLLGAMAFKMMLDAGIFTSLLNAVLARFALETKMAAHVAHDPGETLPIICPKDEAAECGMAENLRMSASTAPNQLVFDNSTNLVICVAPLTKAALSGT